MIHTACFRKIGRQSFLDVKSGRKSVETRAASPKFAKITTGDSLRCVCGQDFVIKKIAKVEKFPSIEALFRKIPLSKVMPEVENLAEAKKIYHSYPNYEEKIKKFGLVAFFLG